MKIKKAHWALFLVFFSVIGYCQDKTKKIVDSLTIEFARATHDTLRAILYQNIAEQLYLSKPDTLIPLCVKTIELCDKDLPKANEQERRVFLSIKSTALNNMGYSYQNFGNIASSLDCYHKGLKIQEELGDKKNVAQSLNNLGYVYQMEKDFIKALDYYEKSLKIREEIDDKRGIGESLNNLGFLYRTFGDPNCRSTIAEVCSKAGMNKAVEFYQRSLLIKEKIKDSIGIAISYNNLGSVYKMLQEYGPAIEYFTKSLKIREHINDKQGIAIALNNLGGTVFRKNNIQEAEAYCLRSLKLGQELGFPEIIKRAAESLRQIYTAKGDYKKVVEMMSLYVQMRDSVNNMAAQKAAVQQQLQYEYEKKSAADSIRINQEKKVIAVELEHEKTQRFALYGGLFLVIVFAGFMFNRFQVTKKQKEIIEDQKHLVEEKQKEIVDSINYAQRIQKALLTSEEVLKDNLPSYFVYFKPKAIVSGDFYWASPLSNGNFCLIVADSTGHGVPGAFMSLLNISVLNEGINEYRLTDPAQLLGHARKRIIKSLSADGSLEGGKDGMDCCLLSFDFKKNKLEYASANNSAWLLRKQNEGVELVELEHDKMPVGKHDKDSIPFKTHKCDLQKGDMLYLFTDGYADQFGGPNGKKYKYKQMEELFRSIANKSMEEQHKLVDESFGKWKGSHEQVDDVCIIGVRI